ncbi:MAG: hypothetical protein BRD49_03455 [Bacteroidetes bacterium SW_10_40_5]|nr:MAG: hypothetical protein BRD49_03455 [Bacteroidetes bacterium SW_10_40_5]
MNRSINLIKDDRTLLLKYSQNLTPQKLQTKMHEWMNNGCRLSWLKDPEQEQAYIYREYGSQQVIEGFDQKLAGKDVLRGFQLELSALWLS